MSEAQAEAKMCLSRFADAIGFGFGFDVLWILICFE
jgi:hypothetical protein